MRTIKTVLAQTTDTKALIQDVKDTLREIDPEYPEEEARFLLAAAALENEIGSSLSPTAGDYLAAQEQEITSAIIYVGWLGFQLNLDRFNNPVNKLILKEDYGDIHRESRLHTLPMAQTALHTIYAFHKAVPADKQHLIDDISSFYAYLKTVAYKLAHYFGFRLADDFLYYVIPGYVSDDVTTKEYARGLRNHLTLDISKLE